MKLVLKISLIGALIFNLWSCSNEAKVEHEALQIVCTTNIVADLVQNIGKDSIDVISLMGAGVDPHLYKASEGDVNRITNADVVFFNGLHLEGKMAEIFERLPSMGKASYAVSDGIPEENYISSENFSGNYDPHIWFSVDNWIYAAEYVSKKLIENDPDSQAYYEENLRSYKNKLEKTRKSIKDQISLLPKDNRILVTAHDAFSYFGKDFDFQVVGLQGISTASEAGTRDVLDMANFIVEKKIPAIFVESSVPKQTILALQSAVQSKGEDVKLGGTLYSDALGNSGTPEGTYIGMFQANVSTIVNALKTNLEDESSDTD
ncbi:zinc ABC transporter solute-binding protein [Flavobacteriaceae bacterium Ap0902]|nr:zinc ABC transporter solute-binding protein [Flavobacteriaceae bacterium Ap0902]